MRIARLIESTKASEVIPKLARRTERWQQSSRKIPAKAHKAKKAQETY